MHRFFVEPSCWRDQQLLLTGPLAHQICHVLRMRPEDRIVVLDNQGQEAEVRLTTVEAKQVCGETLVVRSPLGEPHTKVLLFQSYLKRDKFEWILQKATEVGVTWIVPVVTERCLVRDEGEFKPERLKRWLRILTEAAEQSRRGCIPILEEPLTWSSALERGISCDRALIACPHTASEDLSTGLRELPGGATVGLFIGPEGGFSATEVAQAREKGILPLNLGPRILRTETAAIVAASLILYERGEFAPPILNPEP